MGTNPKLYKSVKQLERCLHGKGSTVVFEHIVHLIHSVLLLLILNVQLYVQMDLCTSMASLLKGTRSESRLMYFLTCVKVTCSYVHCDLCFSHTFTINLHHHLIPHY